MAKTAAKDHPTWGQDIEVNFPVSRSGTSTVRDLDAGKAHSSSSVRKLDAPIVHRHDDLVDLRALAISLSDMVDTSRRSSGTVLRFSTAGSLLP
jgi:hypothetical protein